MKIKIKDLKQNPFKNEINKGKLNEETITKIRSNIKELGLMGALPVFKKDNQYYLIAGHHRLESLKREFGSKYDVECTLHNYSNENVLRGMVVENLTQRADELMEVADNLALIRKFLKNNTERSASEQSVRNEKGQLIGSNPEAGSVRNIYNWLSKKGA